MFIIYGISHRFKSKFVEEFGVCEGCKQRALLRYYTAWATLCFFWLPVFPFKKMRVLRSCPLCDDGLALAPVECQSALNQAMDQAQQALAAGDVEEAIEGAMSLVRLGGFDEAEGILSQLDATDVRVLLARGRACTMQRRFDEAREHLRQAAEAEPSNATAHFLRGQLLCDALEFDEGIAELRKAAELSPQDVEPRLALMDALEFEYKWADLVQVMEEVAGLDPVKAKEEPFTERLKLARKKAALNA